MRLVECEKFIQSLFAELFPECTVVIETGDSARPPLPFIVLKFGKNHVNGRFKDIVDGIPREYWQNTVLLTVELVIKSTIRHDADKKTREYPDAQQSLSELIPFMSSERAGYWMRKHNIAISAYDDPYTVMNSMNGTSSIHRAQCSFEVQFFQSLDDYASLRPEGSELKQTENGLSAAIASERAGYFDEVADIEYLN